MTTVRPPLWPQATTTPVNKGGSQAAGQKAFFEAALGGANAAPSSPTQPVAPIQNRTPTYGAAPKPAQAAVQPTADGEIKYRRPGSILDIRV